MASEGAVYRIVHGKKWNLRYFPIHSQKFNKKLVKRWLLEGESLRKKD